MIKVPTEVTFLDALPRIHPGRSSNASSEAESE